MDVKKVHKLNIALAGTSPIKNHVVGRLLVPGTPLHCGMIDGESYVWFVPTVDIYELFIQSTGLPVPADTWHVSTWVSPHGEVFHAFARTKEELDKSSNSEQ